MWKVGRCGRLCGSLCGRKVCFGLGEGFFFFGGGLGGWVVVFVGGCVERWIGR